MTRPRVAGVVAQAPLRYAGLVGLWIVLRSAVLVTGLLLQAVFNELGGPAHRGEVAIWTLIAGLAAAEAAKLILWYLVILARAEPAYSNWARSMVQANALRQILLRRGEQPRSRVAGDVVSRFGADGDEVASFVTWSASRLSQLVIAIVALAVMLRIDVLVTVGVIAPIAVTILGSPLLHRVIRRQQAASREAASEVSRVVGEAVGGALSVKVSRAEERIVSRLRRASAVRLRAAVAQETTSAVQASLFNSTTAVSSGVLLLLAVSRMRAGSFTVGDLALFFFYAQFLTEAVTSLGDLLVRFQRVEIALRRFAELNGPADRPAVSPAAPLPALAGSASAPVPPLRILEASGLTFRHADGRGICGGQLALHAGSVSIITGRIGAGKTTLLRVLLGLLPKQAGELRWNGREIADPAEFFIPPRAAYVSQKPALFSGTLRENILLGADLTAAELEAVIYRAVLEDDVANLAHGLDTLVGPRGQRLSGGQVQRVAIARAMTRGAQLMVLDDVSSALDIDTEQEFWNRLLDHTSGAGPGTAAVLAVSHRIPTLRRAGQVIVLTDGAVADAGTLPELLGRCAEMRELRAAFERGAVPAPAAQ